MDFDVEKNYARVHSDSGISGRPYEQIVAELKQLETAHPGIAKVITYGQTVGGQDLTMIRIGKPGATTDRPGVLIAGTIHGDEFLNIEDRLPRWFLENQTSPGVAKYLNSGGVIWIAPILNPDGYKARRRENNRGKDLNRDFDLKMANKAGFSQPETSALYKTMQQEVASQNSKLKLTMDYHCCVGALIYPWGHSYDKELPANAKAEHLRLAGKIQEQFPRYKAGRAIEIVNYVAVGASDDFYHETFGATSFTFEGAVNVENRNFDKHTQMWDVLLADQAAASTTPPVAQPTARPTLAILGSDQNNLTLAAAGPAGTASMTLCKGDLAACSSSGNVAANFSSPQQIGERIVFRSAQIVSVTSQDLFTLQARDAAGAIRQSAVFKISAQ